MNKKIGLAEGASKTVQVKNRYTGFWWKQIQTKNENLNSRCLLHAGHFLGDKQAKNKTKEKPDFFFKTCASVRIVSFEKVFLDQKFE